MGATSSLSSHLEDDGDLISTTTTTTTTETADTGSTNPKANANEHKPEENTAAKNRQQAQSVKANIEHRDDIQIDEQPGSYAPDLPQSSFADVDEKEIQHMDYIKPSSQEIGEQSRLCLVHIAHRGHYQQECEYSAQNVLQSNESVYQSTKACHFIDSYQEHDWIVLKINAINVTKITQCAISLSRQHAVSQYPSKICLQFMLSKDIQTVLAAAKHTEKWSKPHFVQPSVLETKRPNAEDVNAQHTDVFTLSLAADYIEELYSNRCPQYVRLCFVDNHDTKNANANDAKYCVQSIDLYGVPLLEEQNQAIKIQQSEETNSKYYKYEIENKFDSALTPLPGKDEARVLMREHVFFISVRNKTVQILKEEILAEYDRLNQRNERKVKYEPKNIVLVLDSYGFINDLADASALKKTLTQIGVKKGKNNTGFYICVGFM